MNSPQYYRNKVWSLNSAAQDYENMGRIHLARLWRYLASYYVVLGNEQDTSEYDQYGNLETLVKRIDRLVDDSLPRNISKRSAGGFGYHGDTPIGENWGIVTTYAPNVASILDESNWESFQKELESFDSDDMTIEYFSSWVTGTENLMIRLIEDNGKPTAIAVKVVELLDRLDSYPVLNENDYSERESESDYEGNIESIRKALNDLWLIDETPDNLNGLIYEWLYENDLTAIEHSESGYSDGGGYITSEAIYIAAYCMGYIDTEAYDSDELDTLLDKMELYIWQDYDTDCIKHAFVGYKTKL